MHCYYLRAAQRKKINNTTIIYKVKVCMKSRVIVSDSPNLMSHHMFICLIYPQVSSAEAQSQAIKSD